MIKKIDQFIDFLKNEKDVSQHTIRAYSKDLQEFHSFTDKRPEKIDNLDIRSFMASLHYKKLKKTSISRKLASIRSFFNYLHKEGYVKKNPAKLVSSPKKPKTSPQLSSNRSKPIGTGGSISSGSA